LALAVANGVLAVLRACVNDGERLCQRLNAREGHDAREASTMPALMASALQTLEFVVT